MHAFDRAQRKHPVLAVPVAVVKKFGDDQGGGLAALVAYYSFFSLFPLLLVFVTVLGFVLQGNPEPAEVGRELGARAVPGDRPADPRACARRAARRRW